MELYAINRYCARDESIFFKFLTITLIVLSFMLYTPVATAAGAGVGAEAIAEAGAGVADAGPAGAEPVVVVCYYNEPCGSCEHETLQEIMDAFWGAAEQVPDKNFSLRFTNTFQRSGLEALINAFDKFGVPKEKRGNTAFVAGNEILIGDLTDADKIKAFLEIAENPDAAELPGEGEGTQPAGILAPSGGEPTLVFFSITACADCESVREILADYADEARVIEYNIAEGESLTLFSAYVDAYSVPDNRQTLPIVFAGERYFNAREIGGGDLRNLLNDGNAGYTLLPGAGGDVAVPAKPLEALQLTGVLLAGLLGGLNPCGVSMFLFMLSLVAAAGRRMLTYGFSFLAGKFTAYWALGLAGYSLFAAYAGDWAGNAAIFVNVIMLALALLLAALCVNDFIAARAGQYAGVRLQLPKRLRALNHKIIRRAADFANAQNLNNRVAAAFTAGCFLLGATISVTEFFCTGQIYIAAITYAIRQGEGFAAHLFLLAYTVAAVLPAAVILAIIRRGKSFFEVSETFRLKMPWIKLLGAIFFALFAVYLFMQLL